MPLEPCPFCGAESPWLIVEVSSSQAEFFVQCLRCQAMGPSRYTAETAQQVWNTRPDAIPRAFREAFADEPPVSDDEAEAPQS